MLFYDSCLLITKNRGKNFSIERFQTDNNFNIRIKAFIYKEEEKIIETKFIAKLQTMLETGVS